MNTQELKVILEAEIIKSQLLRDRMVANLKVFGVDPEENDYVQQLNEEIQDMIDELSQLVTEEVMRNEQIGCVRSVYGYQGDQSTVCFG